jgi:hypothetical protein
MKRRLQKQHRRKVPKSQSFFAVDELCRLAERSGWPGEQAFRVALSMTLHGTTPAEAERAFMDAARRVQ